MSYYPGQNNYPQYPQQYPPQGYPPQQYPGYGAPPQGGYPPQQYPPQPYGQGYGQGYPQQYPPQGYPTQYPQQGYPPQGYPPQGYPPQGYPPQQYPGYSTQPQGGPPPAPGSGSGYGMPPPDAQRPGPPPAHGSGRKKALLIGINYFGTKAELRGCINDVKNVRNFIKSRGFTEDPASFRVLTDDQKDPSTVPTKQNILNAMRWLVADARPGDQLFLHYSGHGGQQEDTDGDEGDGFDETILPVDYQKSGQIVDDLMHEILVKPLHKGVKLFALFDSCHSGTALDLPYLYNEMGEPIAAQHMTKQEAIQRLQGVAMDFFKGKKGGAAMGLWGAAKRHMTGQKAQEVAESKKKTEADVVMISGCRDDQTSADASLGSSFTGAMSFAFIKANQTHQNLTYRQLLLTMRDLLREKKFAQVPQLSSGHPMNMDVPFQL